MTFFRFDIRDRSRCKERLNKRDQSRHLVSSFEGSSRLVEIVAFDRLERNPPSVHHISPTRLPTAQQPLYKALLLVTFFFQKRGKVDTRDTGIQPQDPLPPIRDPTNRKRARRKSALSDPTNPALIRVKRLVPDYAYRSIGGPHCSNSPIEPQ